MSTPNLSSAPQTPARRLAERRRADGTRRAEILCVGTELLLGDILNTNAQYLARGLAALGLDHYIQTVVGDNEERMEQAIRDAMDRADILLFTGGLGPTGDDLTREVVSRCFGRDLHMDEEALENIRAYYRITKREMPPSNEKQALQPEGAIKLENPQGTAPGSILFSDKGHIAVLMPGPPREMRPMFDNLVAPYLRQFSGGALVSRQVRVISLGESKMAEILSDLMEKSENPTLAPYAKDGEAMLRVTARAKTPEEARALTEPILEEVKRRLGRHAYGVDVENVETVVAEMLSRVGLRASFAEAGTASLAAHRMMAAKGGESVVGPCVAANGINELEGVLSAEGRGQSGERVQSAEGTVQSEGRGQGGGQVQRAECSRPQSGEKAARQPNEQRSMTSGSEVRRLLRIERDEDKLHSEGPGAENAGDAEGGSPMRAVERLARLAASRFNAQAACAIAVRDTTHCCAVLLDGRLETRETTLPTRGPDYYRTAAVQACFDLLRNMLMDREEGKAGQGA